MHDKVIRNAYIDTIKGIAIFLVVIGHVIQCYYDNDIFWSNYLFKAIYSFHMPLFMLVSGYLFAFTTQKYSIKIILQRKFTTLVIPIITFSIISIIPDVPNTIINLIDTGHGLGALLGKFKFALTYKLWFLWAVLLSSIIVLIINKAKLLGGGGICTTISMLLMLIPDDLIYGPIKFLFPYFVIGYFYKSQSTYFKINSFISWQWYLTLIAIYVLMLSFYGYNDYIYNSGYDLYNKNPIAQLFTNIFRFTIGLIGSICMLVSLQQLMQQHLKYSPHYIFRKLGQNSLGIYAFHIIFLFIVSSDVILGPIPDIAIYTLCLLIISMLCIFIVKKSHITNFLFLGGRA